MSLRQNSRHSRPFLSPARWHPRTTKGQAAGAPTSRGRLLFLCSGHALLLHHLGTVPRPVHLAVPRVLLIAAPRFTERWPRLLHDLQVMTAPACVVFESRWSFPPVPSSEKARHEQAHPRHRGQARAGTCALLLEHDS